MNLGKYRIEYRSNWPLLASLDTFRKAWTVSITDHVQLILVINRGTRIEYYANKFSTLIPIKPLGLIVHSLCFQGVNVFAIECILIVLFLDIVYRKQRPKTLSCQWSRVMSEIDWQKEMKILMIRTTLFQPNQISTLIKVNKLALLIVLLHAGTCECLIDTCPFEN